MLRLTSAALPLLFVWVGVTLPGCSEPPTQLVVVVDTDIPIPTEMVTVRARVFQMRDGEPVLSSEHFFALSSGESTATRTRVAIPFSFGVTPQGGDHRRRVQVVLEALPPMCEERCTRAAADCECARFQRRAITGFIRRKTLRLPMFLARRCLAEAETCTAEQTCTEDGCADPFVDPSELEEVRAGDELRDATVARMDAELPGGDAGDTGTGEGDAGDAGGGGDAGDGGSGRCVGDSDCDDGIACTNDRCMSGTCVSNADDRVCEAMCEGGYCHGAFDCQCPDCNPDTCTPIDLCQTARCEMRGAGEVCVRTEDGCAPGTICCGRGPTGGGTCNQCCSNADCPDDGNMCNGMAMCAAGTCTLTAPTSCDDAIACTVDTCNPTTGACSNVPMDSLCMAGTGGRCDVSMGGCQYDTCTAATCVADPCGTAMCVGSTCMRDTLCTASQMCCAGMCVPLGCNDGNPCTNDACGASGCAHTPNSAPCTDGNMCTLGDRCSGGTCMPTSTRSCDDGNICTNDSCVPATGCVNANNTASCNDGNICTSPDRCSGGSCTSGAPLFCPPDSNECTMERCGPTTGMCESVPYGTGFMCDDGDPCTFGETCNGFGTCLTGTPMMCDDGNECTDDFCSGGACSTSSLSFTACSGGTCCTGICCAAGCCDGGLTCCMPSDAGMDGGPPDCSMGNCADSRCEGMSCGTNMECNGGTCVCRAGFGTCDPRPPPEPPWTCCPPMDAGGLCPMPADCNNPDCLGAICGTNAQCTFTGPGGCNCVGGFVRCPGTGLNCPCASCGDGGICSS